jgi:hypothetical protein
MVETKSISFLRALLVLAGVCLAGLPVQAQYSGGTGEPNDPYQIATVADLILLGETPADYDKHFIVTADIDLDPNLPGGRVFYRAVIAPDTDYYKSDFQGILFTGVLNGNGHMISHLTIKKGGYYLGLFGVLGSEAEVKDLGVADVNLTDSEEYAGGLVGLNAGSVSNCYCTGSMTSRSDWVGGLAGDNWGYISNSRNMSSVDAYGCFVGGLVGGNSGAISSSLNSGSVNSRGCYVGGLVGASRGLISNCLSTGSINGKGGYVGGLVGANNFGSVSNSYNTGSVAGSGGSIGGLVGGNFGSVSNSHSTGSVAGSGGSIGGLVGENEGSVVRSFWDVASSGCTTSAGGSGLSTAQMQDPNTFLAAGWDFLGERGNGLCETWQVPVEKGHPELSVFMGYLPPLLPGAGTPDDPYVVETPEHLVSVGYRPMACYRLASDIDLSGIIWSAAVVPGFGGAFDGKGHKIRNMTISGDAHLGLFGLAPRGADISGLGLEDVNIVGTGQHVGALVGALGGHVSKSYSTGSIRGTASVGGLVGGNSGYVSESFSKASVTGESGLVGGLVGANQSFIANSYATGPVSGRDDVGGLIGFSESMDVWDCYSTGSVSGAGDHVGGLVGWGDRSTVSRSFWDIATSGRDASAGGRGLTTSQMQVIDTFLNAGWDFVGEAENGTEDIWWIDEGKDYPRLSWERDVDE